MNKYLLYKMRMNKRRTQNKKKLQIFSLLWRTFRYSVGLNQLICMRENYMATYCDISHSWDDGFHMERNDLLTFCLTHFSFLILFIGRWVRLRCMYQYLYYTVYSTHRRCKSSYFVQSRYIVQITKREHTFFLYTIKTWTKYIVYFCSSDVAYVFLRCCIFFYLLILLI